MKKVKKLLFFFCCCLFFGVVYGQGFEKLYFNVHTQGYNNIVRYWQNEDVFINALRDNSTGGYHFTLTDLSTVIDAYFTDLYDVRDMEIFGDMVFFCGQDLSSVSGFIGWFYIPNLFYGAGDIHIDKSLSTQGLQSLDDIEVFADQGGEIHIAGYGLHAILISMPTGTPYKVFRAFEAVGNPLSTMQYRVADLYSAGINSEISDMAVTDHYVVYIQCSGNQLCDSYGTGIDLNVFPKYNMFSGTYYSLGQFQTIGHHNFDYLGCSYVLRDNSDPDGIDAKMVPIGDDKVAVCTYRADLNYPNSGFSSNCGPCPFKNEAAFYLAHRVYDLSPVLVNNPMLMISAAVVQLPNSLKKLEDFVYNNSLKSYVAVHTHETAPGVSETAFTTMDFLLGIPPYVFSEYQVTYNTINNWSPTSVCLFGDGEYLVSGNDMTNFDQIFWRSYFNNNLLVCDRHVQYPMWPISTMEAKDNIWPINTSGWVSLNYIDYCTKNRVEDEVNIKCE